MTPHLLGAHRGDTGGEQRKVVRRVYRNHDTARKPFYLTHFGRLPPELREKIFIGLLADPPSYAGHDTISPGPTKSPAAPGRFVHIKGSWYQVTQTCRQIYLESHPIFFAAKAYYLENTQDMARFLDPPNLQILRCDTITALCLKDLMEERPLYTTERINVLLAETNDQDNSDRRRRYETMTDKSFDYRACYKAKELKNLRTVGLCMKVGEEMLYIDFLYFLSGMNRGLVEFVDASRWLIRPQSPEDIWSIQYACFTYADYARGKDDEFISYDRRSIEEEVTDIDSRAPDLKEGDERYIEVQIQRPVVEKSSKKPIHREEGNIDWDTTSTHSESSLSSYDFDEARFQEVSSDESEEETGIESGSGMIDQSSFLDLNDENGRTTQAATSKDQEENPDLLQNAGEEVPDTEPIAEDGHTTQAATNTDQKENQYLLQTTEEEVSDTQPIAQHEQPIQESPSAQITQPPATMNDRLLLLDADLEDDQVETDTRSSDQVTWVPDLHDRTRHERNSKEHNLENGVKEGTRIRSIYRSSTSKLALLDISDSPNPYTEEEMKSYGNWSQPATTKDQGAAKGRSRRKEKISSPSEEVQTQHAKAPVIRKLDFVVVLQHLAELLVRPVQTGAVLLLFLLLVKIPEHLSNAS